MSRSLALQPDSAWAEDRAMLRSNPSADPGAKTEGGGGLAAALTFTSPSGLAPKR